MSRGSLRLRLLLAGIVSVVVALALSAAGLTLLFERHVERRVESELAVYLDQVIAGLDRDTQGNLAVLEAPADPRFSEPLSGLYWRLQAGETVLRSRSLWDADLSLPPDELPEGDVAAASPVIERVMANAAEPAVKLTVPLAVEIGTGRSWGAAH